MNHKQHFYNKIEKKSDKDLQIPAISSQQIQENKRIFELSSVHLANTRSLLLEDFSVKEIKILIDRLPKFKRIYGALPEDTKKYLAKEKLVELLIQKLNGEEELAVLLLLAKEFKPVAYQKHYPYLPENIQSSGSIDTLTTMFVKEDSEEAVTELNNIDNLAKLRAAGEEEFRKKKLRRRIKEEFAPLIQRGESCSENEVTDFYIKYLAEIKLMEQALTDIKNLQNKAAHLVWMLLSEGVTDDRVENFLKRRLIVEKKSRVEAAIPEIVKIVILAGTDGPTLEIVLPEYIKEHICQFLRKEDQDFSVKTNGQPYQRLGIYDVSMAFSDEIIILRKLQLVLQETELPIEFREDLKDVPALIIGDQDGPMIAMQSFLAGTPTAEILDYYPRLGKVLVTAHEFGYWNTTWVQDVAQDWLFEKDDYILAQSSEGYATNQLLSVKKSKKIDDHNSPDDKLMISIEKIWSLLSNGSSSSSEANRNLQSSFRLVSRDVIEYEFKSFLLGNVPNNYRELNDELLQYLKKPNDELSDRFLKLARKYAEIGRDSFFRFSLEIYCLSKSRLLFKDRKRETRPYVQLYLFLHNQNLPEHRNPDLEGEFYKALAVYLNTYAIAFELRNSPSNITEEFYSNLMKIIAQTSGRLQSEALGRSILEIMAAVPPFVSDLINRMKTARTDNIYASRALRKLSEILQEHRVFRLDCFSCLQLINKIDPKELPLALSHQNLTQIVERRQVAVALIKLGSGTNVSPDTMLNGFAQQASNDLKKDLAFSILIEPFFLNSPKESQLKEALIVDVLGFPPGTKSTEFFGGRIKELADLFDKFSRSTSPNIKGPVGITINETIRITRKWLLEELRGDLKDLMLQFFRTVEGYTTAEQSKLIHDTTLEISIASDRAVYSSTQTRLTLEIRNVGEGMADGLELTVIPQEGQYNVDDRFRKIILSNTLADKTPFQTDIFIQPLIGANKSIELELMLKYNTLKNKGKIAELPSKNKNVYLYPETQFIRVSQPYSISAPATTWFYGRHDLLESLADNLHHDATHDTSAIVYGLRRAGKTSVVKRLLSNTLKERELDKVYIPIYADLLADNKAQSILTDGDFLFYLIQLINRYLPIADQLSVDLFHEAFLTDPYAYFSNTIDTIINTVSPYRLLIVLDEFSVLYSKLKIHGNDASLTGEVFSYLSNIIQSKNQLTFIFTGTYILLEMMREHAFDLAKICIPKLVAFLDDESARRLVTEPVSKKDDFGPTGWLEYDPRVVDRIVSITGRHPYLIQNFCMLLVDRMNMLKLIHVNLRDLDSVVDDIISQPAYGMNILALWNEFDSSQHKLLSVIATSSNSASDWVEIDEMYKEYTNNEGINKDELVKICSSLADAALLEKSNLGANDLYRLTIPLYQMWLKQNKPPSLVFRE